MLTNVVYSSSKLKDWFTDPPEAPVDTDAKIGTIDFNKNGKVAKQFGRVLWSLIEYAAKDESRPSLSTIQLSYHNGALRMAAADGYILGVVDYTLPVEGNGLAILHEPAMFKASELKDIARELKKSRVTDIPPVIDIEYELEHEGTTGGVRLLKLIPDVKNGHASIILQEFENGQFPGWQQLLPDNEEVDLSNLTFNPDFIKLTAELCKQVSDGGGYGKHWQIYGFNGTGPAVFQSSSDNFKCAILLMPLHRATETYLAQKEVKECESESEPTDS